MSITSFLIICYVGTLVHDAHAGNQWIHRNVNHAMTPSFAPTISTTGNASPPSFMPSHSRTNGRPASKELSKRKKLNKKRKYTDAGNKYPTIPKRKRKIVKQKKSTKNTSDSSITIEAEHRRIVSKTKKILRNNAVTTKSVDDDDNNNKMIDVVGSRETRTKKRVKGKRRKKSQQPLSSSYNSEGRTKKKRKVLATKGEITRSPKVTIDTTVRRKKKKRRKLSTKKVRKSPTPSVVVNSDSQGVISKELSNVRSLDDEKMVDVVKSTQPQPETNATQISLTIGDDNNKIINTTDDHIIDSSSIQNEVPIYTIDTNVTTFGNGNDVVLQSSNIFMDDIHATADVEINTEFSYLSNQSTTAVLGITEAITSHNINESPNTNTSTSGSFLVKDDQVESIDEIDGSAYELQSSDVSEIEDDIDEQSDVDLNLKLYNLEQIDDSLNKTIEVKLPIISTELSALSIPPNIDDIHFVNASDVVTTTLDEVAVPSSSLGTTDVFIDSQSRSKLGTDDEINSEFIPDGDSSHGESDATIEESINADEIKMAGQGYTIVQCDGETNVDLESTNTSNEVISEILEKENVNVKSTNTSTFPAVDNTTENSKDHYGDQAEMIEQDSANVRSFDDKHVHNKVDVNIDDEMDDDEEDDDDDDDDNTDISSKDNSSASHRQDQRENKNESFLANPELDDDSYIHEADPLSSHLRTTSDTTEQMSPSLAPVQSIGDVVIPPDEIELSLSSDIFDNKKIDSENLIMDPIKDEKHLTVSIVTWNLAEESPSEEDAMFLKRFRNNDKGRAHGSDLVLISGQECENIKPRRSEGSRSREFRRLMILMLGKGYVPLALHLLGGIQFGLFCKRSMLGDVEQASVADVTCGIGNVLHNKGAIGCFLKIKSNDNPTNNPDQQLDKSIRMLFVTAHMAAHVKNTEARDLDFWRIIRELELQAPARFFSGKNPATETTGKFLLDSTDRIFFCGDLNYRIDLPREEVEYAITRIRSLVESKVPASLSEAQELRDRLFKFDQLRATIALERAFPGFAEGRITFAPTFKFDKGTGEYDTSHKQRIPAWTDRVLYKPIGTHVLEYDSITTAQHSDHRPVFATFLVDMTGRALKVTKRRKQSSTRKRKKGL